MPDPLHVWQDGKRVFVGPEYTITSAALQNHRRAARKGGLSAMTKADRNAYGEAVEKAVLSAQRSALLREGSPLPSGCGYGKALLAKLNAQLLAYPDKVRRARTDAEWREMYARAMAEKAEAEEARKMAEIDKRIARQQRAMKLKPKSKTRRSRAA
jgi:hypothetical protein